LNKFAHLAERTAYRRKVEMHQEMVNEKYEIYGDDPEDGQGQDYDSEFDEEVIQFK
jgi:hypothetical protein